MSFSAYNTPTEVIHDVAETRAAPDPLIGRFLDGKYEIISRLGEGGMGAVYRGRRVHIGDEVAVKVLLHKFLSVPTAVERFRREARAAAMLRHPNVVAIYDFAEATSDGAIPAYIVMEMIHGESLRDLLQREGKIEFRRAISMMRDICAGVGAGHKREVIHRDIKPDNIIVIPPDDEEDRETIKVVDFGIAKLRDFVGGLTLTQTGMAMGTPFYMSPEQCKGDPLDTRSDVYSLGALLYEMLAGSPPFVARTATGVVAKHLTEAPPPLQESLGIPSSVEAVIMRALSKDADARQKDAMAFSRELQQALAQPTEDHPAPKTHEPATRGNLAPTRLTAEPLVVPTTPAPPPPSQQSQETIAATVPERPSSTGPITAPDLGFSSTATQQPKKSGAMLWVLVAAAGVLIAGLIGAWSFGLFSDDADGSNQAATSKQAGGATSASQAAPGTLLRTLTAQRELFEVAISPDAQTVVSTGDENRLRLWKSSDGSLIREISGYQERGRAVAFSPDGKVIASGNDDGAVRIWNASDGRLLQTLQGHTKYVFIVGFSPDSEKMVSAGADKVLRMWRVSDGAQLGSITVTAPDELIITVNPEQYLLALLGPDKGVKLWSIRDNALLRPLEGHKYKVTSGAFSVDGKVLALGSDDGIVRLWDVSNGKLLRSMEGVKGEDAGSVAFSPAGDVVAAGWGDGSIRTWKVADGSPLVTLEGHKKGVHTLSFSSDGKVLASGSDDKTIRLWQVSR